MARIEVAVPELAGVAIDEGLVRHYPYGATAAHVLGYVAAVSEKELTGDPLLELPDFRIGKSGIEKSQEWRLRGVAGTSEVEVNAYGRVVRELSRVGRASRARTSCSGSTWRCRSSSARAAPRAQRRLRAARRGHRRRARAGVEPEPTTRCSSRPG